MHSYMVEPGNGGVMPLPSLVTLTLTFVKNVRRTTLWMCVLQEVILSILADTARGMEFIHTKNIM